MWSRPGSALLKPHAACPPHVACVPSPPAPYARRCARRCFARCTLLCGLVPAWVALRSAMRGPKTLLICGRPAAGIGPSPTPPERRAQAEAAASNSAADHAHHLILLESFQHLRKCRSPRLPWDFSTSQRGFPQSVKDISLLASTLIRPGLSGSLRSSLLDAFPPLKGCQPALLKSPAEAISSKNTAPFNWRSFHAKPALRLRKARPFLPFS